jgi:hypothetical protein
VHLFIADDSDVLIERLIEILSDTEGVQIVGQEGYANKVVEALLEKNYRFGREISPIS